MIDPVVPELDILIGTSLWVWHRGARPVRVSVSSGSQSPKWEDEGRLRKVFEEAGIPTDYSSSSDGADLVAESTTEVWTIECKGAGTGVGSTKRIVIPVEPSADYPPY